MKFLEVALLESLQIKREHETFTWQVVTWEGYPCRRPRSLIKRVTSGGLPHLGGLPYLPGVPHLHVNRPKVASTITLIHLPPVVCDAPLNYRLIKTLESVSCSTVVKVNHTCIYNRNKMTLKENVYMKIRSTDGRTVKAHQRLWSIKYFYYSVSIVGTVVIFNFLAEQENWYLERSKRI